MNWRNVVVVMVSAGMVAACTKSTPKADTPEGALHSYVVAAFEARQLGDKKKLMELSTGDARGYLERMSDEDFRKQFVDAKLQFVSMKARDLRQEVSGDTSLVYELSYKDARGGSPTVHTNKKIAYLTKDEAGHWRIKATKNVKTFVERKEDLLITPETTEAPGAAGDQQK